MKLFKSESEKRVLESKAFSEEFIRGLASKPNLLDVKQYKNNSKLLERHLYEVSMPRLELSLTS